jgi:hypothetical protein
MEFTTPKNYRLSLISVVLALACLAAAYFVFTQFWPKYTNAKINQDKAQSINLELNKTQASLQAFLKNFEAQKQKADLSNLALPAKNSDMANFTSNLAELAAASGVSLSGLQVAEVAQEKLSVPNTIAVQNLTLSMSGTFPSFQDFMTRVENNLRLIDTYHVTMRLDSGQSLSYQILMRTYYQK